MSVTAAVERLQRAQALVTACPPVRDLLTGPDLDAEVELAYQVQQAVIGARLQRGSADRRTQDRADEPESARAARGRPSRTSACCSTT